jgi:hypothetical protein
VVNIGRWSSYEGGQLDRFYCTRLYLVVGHLSVLFTEQLRVSRCGSRNSHAYILAKDRLLPRADLKTFPWLRTLLCVPHDFCKKKKRDRLVLVMDTWLCFLRGGNWLFKILFVWTSDVIVSSYAMTYCRVFQSVTLQMSVDVVSLSEHRNKALCFRRRNCATIVCLLDG